jgi:hypothetical protein
VKVFIDCSVFSDMVTVKKMSDIPACVRNSNFMNACLLYSIIKRGSGDIYNFSAYEEDIGRLRRRMSLRKFLKSKNIT